MKQVRYPIIGASMDELRRTITRVAADATPVLIWGESGTGKTLVARAIHEEYQRSSKSRRGSPLVVIDNADAISADRFVQKLYGRLCYNEKAPPALVGGAIEGAVGGSMIVENLDEFPPSSLEIMTGVLPEEVFDPAYSIKVLSTARDVSRLPPHFVRRCTNLYVPPLRDRRGDIPPLAMYFFTQLETSAEVEPNAWNILAQGEWRANNVRELQGFVEQCVVTSATGERIDPAVVTRQYEARARSAATLGK